MYYVRIKCTFTAESPEVCREFDTLEEAQACIERHKAFTNFVATESTKEEYDRIWATKKGVR